MPASRSDIRNRVTVLLYLLVPLFCIAIAALIVGGIGLHKIVTFTRLEIVTGLYQNLPLAISPSQSDTTLVVIGCTNSSISGTNDVISEGKVLIANNCPVIEDNQCQEHVCTSEGACARRTITGGECSIDAQCVDDFGPGYICNLTLCECQVMVPVNGSMYTNSLVCSNNGTMGVVVVMDAECPMPDQVLTAIDSASANWQFPNREIPCDTGDVVVSDATCPAVGQALIATGPGMAEWQDIPMIAGELKCDTGEIVISNATCPTDGQVLTSTGPGTAEWQDPNLEIPCDTGDVVVSNATCPTEGQMLVATGPGTAEWQDPNLEIPCDTGDVIVSNATCPTEGQVLTATGPGTAEWQDVATRMTGLLNVTGPFTAQTNYTISKVGDHAVLEIEALLDIVVNSASQFTLVGSPDPMLTTGFVPIGTFPRTFPAVVSIGDLDDILNDSGNQFLAVVFARNILDQTVIQINPKVGLFALNTTAGWVSNIALTWIAQ